ncbi:MAG: PAS domain-containing protein, partial [Bacillota bacterium]|nr:PAS domain-containing protein [Bacillota bacterium]
MKETTAVEKRSTILVVDDVFVNRALLKKAFFKKYDVLEAKTGLEALNVLQTADVVSAVVLDLMMPEMDGYEVLEAMKKDARFADIPVVVVTGREDEESQLKALDLGALDVIVKPFNAKLVLRRVENILAYRQAAVAAKLNEAYKAELQLKEEQLYLTSHDSVTGLLNRTAFTARVREMIDKKPAGSYVLSCLDVDNFKLVNDRFGYEEGDKLLRFIAKIRNDEVEKVGGIVCRDMADLFLALLPRDETTITQATDRFFEAIGNYSLPIPVDVHIGRYVIDDLSLDVNLMIDRALLAVRSIKSSTNDRVAWFDEKLLRLLLREQELTDDMRRALDAGEFSLYFQPQYDYTTGALSGAEALVRWFHPEKGLISPSEFIPLFEKNGFITNLDLYVWERACRYLREWLDAGLDPVPVSVNISRRDIRALDLPAVIPSLIEKYGLQPQQLHLEITESAYVNQPEELIAAVASLQRRGFLIEMDDFGSGYSALNILKDVPVDVLKLDMQFSRETDEHSRGGSILSSVVRMAHWLRLPTIAEGVETMQQADYLSSIGCYIMQGYLFAKPMPADEYEALLRKRNTSETLFQTKSDDKIESTVDFFDASTQATLLFNSFVGGAQIVEHNGSRLESLRVNEQFYKMVGVSQADYEQYRLNLFDRFYPESRELLRKTLEYAAATGEEAQCELHSRPVKDGAPDFWTNTRLRFLGKKGNGYLFYLTSEDITGRKELDTIRQRLDDVVRNVPAGISIYDWRDDGIYPLLISDRVCEMFGYTREEYDRRIAAGLPTSFMPSAEYLKLPEESSGESQDCIDRVFPAQRQDGSWFWLRVYGSLVWDERGRRLLYATLFDVTEQKQMEESLEKSDLRAQALIANTPGGVIAIALRDGRESCEYISEGVARLMGYSYEETQKLFEQDIYAVIHPEDRARIKKHSAEAVASMSVFSEQYRLMRADGGVVWVNLTGNPVKGSDGVLRYYCAYTDITEQMEISESLRLEQQKTNAALRMFNIAVWEFDIIGRRIIMLNKAKEGSMPDVIQNVPESFREQSYVDPASLDAYIALHERVMAGEDNVSGTILMKLSESDGFSWVNISYHTIYSGGRPVSAIGSAVNADAEVQSNMRAREVELAMEASSLYFWTYDYRTGVRQARNHNARRFDEISRDEPSCEAVPGFRHVMPDSLAELERFAAGLRAGEISDETITLHLDRAAMGVEWLRVHCALISDNDKTAVLTIVGEDVSEQLRKEQDYAAALRNMEALHDGSVTARVQANLTRDSFITWRSRFSRDNVSYSEGLELLIEKIATSGQRERLRAALSRESLLKAFAEGRTNCAVTYQILPEENERPVWIKTTASVYRDPDSGDIMTFQYDYNVDDEVSVSAIATTLADKVYELVALIYPDSGIMHYYNHGPLKELGFFAEKDYHIDGGQLTQRFIVAEYRDKAAELLSLETIQKHLEHAGTYTVVLPVEYNGERYWKKWGFFWLDEDKSAIIMVCTDVTNLEDLRAVNEDMRFALQSSDIVICHYDAKKQILTIPEAYAASVGLPAVMENVPYSANYVFTGDNSAYIRFYESILAGQEQGEGTLQFTFPNGRTVWERRTFRTSFDEEGAPESAVITIRDITKQREQEIENHRNRILVEQNNIAIIDYDFINDVMYFEGKRADKGFVKREFPGYYDYIVSSGDVTPESAEAIRALIREMLENPANGSLEYQADLWGTGYRWVRLSYSTLVDGSGRAYRLIGQAQDIQQEREREALLSEFGSRVGRDMPAYTYDPTIVSQIFQFLYGSADMDEAIESVLALLGEHYGVSRAYICEDDATNSISKNTFEWCAPGVASQKDKLQNVSYGETLNGEYAGLFNEHNICLCPDIRTLPEAMRKILAEQDIKGLIMCNIMDNGRMFGMVGFDDCSGEIAWTEELTGTLSLVSIILGTFLIKQRQRRNAALSEDFLEALDENAFYIYVVDPNTHEMIYTNRAIRERFSDVPLGSRCYEAAVGLDQPCENCSMHKLRESGVSEPVEVLRKDGLWMLSQASRISWNGKDAYMVVCTDITEHKQMEDALRVSGEEKEIVIRQSGKYVFLYDIRTGTANNVVDAFELLQLPKVVEDYENLVISRGIVCPKSVETCRAFFAEMRAGKPSDAIELCLRHSDNTERWYRADSTTVFEGGKPHHAVISFYDCTEQREKERRLQVEQVLSDVMRNISGGVYCYSLGDEIRLEYASDTLCEMVGYSKQELTDIFSCERSPGVYAEDLDLFSQTQALVKSSPQTVTIEYRVICRDGTPCWVSDTIRSIRREDGVMMAYGAVSKIDEEHTAQVQLRALTNSVPGGIILYEYADGKLSMQYFNDTLCRITGYSREEYQRMAEANPWVLVHEEDIEPLSQALGELLATGRQLEHEYRITTASGLCWIHITAEIVERIGDRFRLVAVLMDVSERKRAEAAAKFHDYCLNQVDSALSAGTIINGLGLHAPLYHVSENIEKLLGYTVEEFKSMFAEQYERIIHPEDYSRVLELNNKYAEELP